MIHVALIVEGFGDVSSLPTLVAKIGNAFGTPTIAPNPIRAGGAEKLRRPGELERFAEMAASRPEADAVVVAVDLEDECAANLHAEFVGRCRPIAARFGKSIRVCFAIREFESWLLSSIPRLRQSCPEYNWNQQFVCRNPPDVRGAKEAVSQAIQRRYRETVDQLVLTRGINPCELFCVDRSFRKLVKSVTDVDYDLLRACAEPQLS